MSYNVEADWITKAGLRAVVIVGLHPEGTQRARCGYVGVPKESSFYGKSYDEQLDCISQDAANTSTLGDKSPLLAITATCGSDDEDNSTVRRSLDIVINCHGGLTYSSKEGSNKYPVESELHWFGFDCAHYGDAYIELSEFAKQYGFGREGTVRTLEYCKEQCESIADQLLQLDLGIKS